MVSGVPWIFLERERKSFEMARLWMRRGQDDGLWQKPAYSVASPQGGSYSFSLLTRSCSLEHRYAWQGIEASSAASWPLSLSLAPCPQSPTLAQEPQAENKHHPCLWELGWGALHQYVEQLGCREETSRLGDCCQLLNAIWPQLSHLQNGTMSFDSERQGSGRQELSKSRFWSWLSHL